jgi:type IV secretory pathway TraG/TraD family ATPase VirD4
VKPIYTVPKRIGRPGGSAAGLFVFLLGLALTCWGMTEALAFALHFNPSLGRPLGHHVYAIWKWGEWAWKIYGPLSGWALPVDVKTHTVPLTLAFAAFGGFALTIVVSTIVAGIFRGDDGNVSSANDAAHFATKQEIARAGLLRCDAGPIIGAVSSGVFGMIRRPMTYAGELGLLHIAPSGDGKTTALIITNLLRSLRHRMATKWSEFKRKSETYGEEPCVFITDPSKEAFHLTSHYQRHQLGKFVHYLEPFGEDVRRGSFNPLWEIRLGTADEATDCRRSMEDSMQLESDWRKNYWDSSSQALGESIFAFLGYTSLWKNDPTIFSYPGVVSYLQRFKSIDEMIDDMQHTPHDPHFVFGLKDKDGNPTTQREWIVGAAQVLLNKTGEEKSGTWNSMTELFSLYRGERIAQCCETSSFSFADIINNPEAPSAVYLAVKVLDSPIAKPYVRQVVRSLFRAATQDPETINGRTVRAARYPSLVILEELIALGPLRELEDIAATGRKSGVIPWLFVQAQEQINRVYPHASFQENIGVHVYGRPQLPSAAEPIAKGFGSTSELIERVSTAQGGKATTSMEIHTRPNMTANELTTLPKDEAIVRVDGLIIRCFKYFFFLSSLAKRAKIGATQETETAVIEPPYQKLLRETLGVKKFARLFDEPPEKPAKERWVQVRKLEVVLPKGSRVIKTDLENMPDGAKRFALRITLAGRARPLLEETYMSSEMRERAYFSTLKEVEDLEPPPVPGMTPPPSKAPQVRKKIVQTEGATLLDAVDEALT